jgi:hypothetical protein
MSLRNVAMPGSHDTGTYSIPTTLPLTLSPDAPTAIMGIYALVPGGPDLVCIWAVAQPQPDNITQQLEAGARAFDFRVLNRKGTLCVAHSLWGGRLYPMIDQLAKFLDSNPNEIVFVDCSHFVDLTDDDHKTLINYLSSKLRLMPRTTTDVTVGQILGQRKQVVLLYEYDKMWKAENNSLWNFLWQNGDFYGVYSNTHQLPDALSHISDEVSKRQDPTNRSKFYWLSGQLTPPEDGTATDLMNFYAQYTAKGGLVGLANDSNPGMLNAIKLLWADKGLNIIGMDNVSSSSTFDLAVLINLGLPTGFSCNVSNNRDATPLDGLYIDTTPIRVPPGKRIVGVRWCRTD